MAIKDTKWYKTSMREITIKEQKNGTEEGNNWDCIDQRDSS